jgi:hypothetical protein
VKVPLLEYLGKLEATVKAAPQGDWSAPKGGWPSSRYGEVVSNEQPTTEGYGGKLIAESCDKLVAPHIVATQPKATLALIAKLREAVALLDDMNVGCTPFDERWFALQQIEVPE